MNGAGCDFVFFLHLSDGFQGEHFQLDYKQEFQQITADIWSKS